MELTKSEMEIMDEFWENGVPLSRSDLLGKENKCWKDSSVHILLNGLLKKGLLREAGMVRRSKTYGRTFEPTMTLTRAQVVRVLYNMEGAPETEGANPFTDVLDGKWYTKAVIWAAENDVVAGKGNGTFAPNELVTREQFANMMRNYAKFKGQDTSATVTLEEFSDTDQIHSWALASVKWAVQEGVISGKGNGKLDPLGTATRAECAQILYNYLEK